MPGIVLAGVAGWFRWSPAACGLVEEQTREQILTTQCAGYNDGDKYRRRIPLWSDKEEGKGREGVKIGKSFSEEVTPELSHKDG